MLDIQPSLSDIKISQKIVCLVLEKQEGADAEIAQIIANICSEEHNLNIINQLQKENFDLRFSLEQMKYAFINRS